MKLPNPFPSITASESIATPYYLANSMTAYLLFYTEERAFTEATESTFANLPAEEIVILRFRTVLESQTYPRVEVDHPTFVELIESDELDYHRDELSEIHQYLIHIGEFTYDIVCESVELIKRVEPTMKEELARIAGML